MSVRFTGRADIFYGIKFGLLLTYSYLCTL
jgi:hypothetical protein